MTPTPIPHRRSPDIRPPINLFDAGSSCLLPIPPLAPSCAPASILGFPVGSWSCGCAGLTLPIDFRSS
ncbi:hypothetical protein G7K_3327-t1 [Saitoella complicata NRRL Y-17804]|uniref:Uncharacterized protein n=1 Tax=Saitoella complicata (strain BCRC 22490 / CBS 7301 / JCM 7358 / NBRC 10748 / NRRL Y-17804) TaxID=698492 RepID=A0A0E9NH50_SAICN|nr:hypothetical protein G7K_3327-t1 [Saitoella complicata NRRL Y-17804]